MIWKISQKIDHFFLQIKEHTREVEGTHDAPFIKKRKEKHLRTTQKKVVLWDVEWNPAIDSLPIFVENAILTPPYRIPSVQPAITWLNSMQNK